MILQRTVLEKWKEDEGRTWTWLARQANVRPETIYQQLGGRTGVSLRLALALEDVTGIPIRKLVTERPGNE